MTDHKHINEKNRGALHLFADDDGELLGIDDTDQLLGLSSPSLSKLKRSMMARRKAEDWWEVRHLDDDWELDDNRLQRQFERQKTKRARRVH